MNHVKVDRKGTKATVTCQSKGRAAVKNSTVKMHANVGSHVLRANTQDLFLKSTIKGHHKKYDTKTSDVFWYQADMAKPQRFFN